MQRGPQLKKMLEVKQIHLTVSVNQNKTVITKTYTTFNQIVTAIPFEKFHEP